MRKSVFLISFLVLLAGCQRASEPAQKIAVSHPIMPIRMSSDTMHVVLTDYVPALYGDTGLWEDMHWITDEAIECLNISGTLPVVREMDLVNRNRSIHSITFYDQNGSFEIPVLPNKPVRQALISMGYEDDKLRVGFYDSVANPSFKAFWQNMLVDYDLWQAGADGTWTLDIGALCRNHSAVSGRSFLRIYAEDETFLYNDMLLPMQDGKIITDAAQLNRHDQQAQVLYSVLIDRFYNGNESNDW